MTWFDKIKWVEPGLGECLELGRKNWDTAHIERRERVVSLASSTRHRGEIYISMLVGALERHMSFAHVTV